MGLFHRKHTYVFMPQLYGHYERCRVVKETEKMYLLRHRVGFAASELLQWDEDTWIKKTDPRIIEVVVE
jgi:hypothetical protein